MFEQFNSVVVQRDPSIKLLRKRFHIRANNNIIGILEEHDNTAGDWLNHIIRFTSLQHLPSILMEVKDVENNVYAIIKKERGFRQLFQVFTKNGVLIATIETKDKVNSPVLYVKNGISVDWLEARGKNGAFDFTIINKESNKTISNISRRSLIYQTVKDNLLNDDGYFIDMKTTDLMTAITLVTVAFIIDINYFSNNR